MDAGAPNPAFRQTLTDWLEVELPNYFIGRLLNIDAAVADRWGRVQASAGRTLPVIDGMLAATALEHDLTLVTRNTKDFAGLGVQLIARGRPERQSTRRYQEFPNGCLGLDFAVGVQGFQVLVDARHLDLKPLGHQRLREPQRVLDESAFDVSAASWSQQSSSWAILG